MWLLLGNFFLWIFVYHQLFYVKKKIIPTLLWILCNCSSNLQRNLKKYRKNNNSQNLRKLFLDSINHVRNVMPKVRSCRLNGVAKAKIKIHTNTKLKQGEGYISRNKHFFSKKLNNFLLRYQREETFHKIWMP